MIIRLNCLYFKKKKFILPSKPDNRGKNLWAIKLNNGVDQIGVAGSDKHGNGSYKFKVN